MSKVDYFIQKFEAIPEEKWHVGSYSDRTRKRHCALGHCGTNGELASKSQLFGTAEADDLVRLFIDYGLSVVNVNDGNEPRFPQPTPKQRILAALREIKSKQEGK